MITEIQDEFAADFAWGTMMDERMIQADFDDEQFEDRPRYLDDGDFDSPCGHKWCDCGC